MPNVVAPAPAAVLTPRSSMRVSARQPRGRAWVLAVAAWFALAAGLAQLAVLAVQKYGFHRPTETSPQAVWMAPLANLLLFAGPALALAAVVPRMRTLVTLERVAGAFAALGFFGLTLLYSGFYRWAALLLALGLGVQTARLVAARPVGFRRTVRAGLVAMPALAAAMGVGYNGWRMWREARALAALPAAAAGAPNVLVLILDTVRAASTGLGGHAEPTTPALDSLARGGVVFERAYAPAPWTLPSHASLFTGRWPHELSTGWHAPLDGTAPTLAEALAARGYATAGFVSNVIYASAEYGLDRGFAHYEDYPVNAGELVLSAPLAAFVANSHHVRRLVGRYDVLGRKDADRVTGDFRRWRARLGARGGRPWMAFLNLNDAHEPYVPKAPFDARFGSLAPRRMGEVRFWRHEGTRLGKARMTPAEVQAEQDAYEGTIAGADRAVGRLLAELARDRTLERTVVIVAGDHGEQFGERPGLFTHANSLYLPALHVPLVVVAPGRAPAGARVAAPVSLRDLAATVVDLAGARGDAFPGRSLARHWGPTPNVGAAADASDEPVLAELQPDPTVTDSASPLTKGGLASVIEGPHHYIRNGDGSEELYDVLADPGERRNLAAAPEGRAALARLRAALVAMTRGNGGLDSAGRPAPARGAR